MSILISILAFIVAIGVLVTVHEYGHFWVARRLGIRVLRFSIGFGRPILRRRFGADRTEFVVSSIPLGGYVKMLDEREGQVPTTERHRAFNRQPIPTRMAVLVAGPLANVLFAIAAYWLMFVIGVPGLRPIVGEVEPDSYAARAGLQAGDEIRRVGDRETATWEGAMLALLDELLDDGRVPLTVRPHEGGSARETVLEIGDDLNELTEPGQLFTGLGISAWSPRLPPELGEVIADGPAGRAGLRSGDLVLAADGTRIATWSEFVDFVRARPGAEIELEIRRDGAVQRYPLVLDSTDENGTEIGRIGAAVHYPEGLADSLRAEQRYGPLAAIGVAAAKTWDMSALTLRMLWRMLSGDVSVRNISGPINIAQYAGYTASIGLVPFLSFLAIVSVSLALLNLMPIPMLDGGQLLYQCIELVKGSPLSERAELIGQQIGIAMLLVLMSFAFYNDIARLVG